ncbi:hypothetical protein [Salmonella bongori]|uniref:Uncharacterized protein n=1 Tax=Salmonella enterica TaxID=28901 RepID=A0A750KFI3_SALER|nr:hypothetical protein [Salmonella bongori]EDP8623976.1 hypothetical protein [Salmonella bongori]EGS1129370.1 hypothetical protein [Salmonella bongori CFSAN000509]MBA2135774.1 hypothetical protein [Salmonella bongori serovar 66:z39:-]
MKVQSGYCTRRRSARKRRLIAEIFSILSFEYEREEGDIRPDKTPERRYPAD